MKNNIRVGSWETVLADQECDSLITDPPYGERTHKGQSAVRDPLGYDHWTKRHVRDFVESWAPRTRNWMICFCSHDLISAYERAYHDVGRIAFAPIVVIQKVPRFQGDGPSNWARYLMRSLPAEHDSQIEEVDAITFALVSRPRTREAARWRALPGAYTWPCERGAPIRGAKPVRGMRELVRDYSDAGDLICDPCAGWGSTRLAALSLGRRFIGSERSRAVRDAAMTRPAHIGDD